MRTGPGTRALITGASSGIGHALAAALAGRGATLGLVARSEDRLRESAAALPGDGHVVLPCDVGDPAAIREATAAFIEQAGGLELVVANAGIARFGPVHRVDPGEVEAMTRVNWLGTVNTVHAALGHLLGRAEGHIVVISSAAAMRGFPWAAAYAATKAAQRAWADALWHELSGSGIGVTTVFPGEFRSELHAGETLMPDWYRSGGDPRVLVEAIVAAVGEDRRYVHEPRAVRVLGALHGLSPRLTDALLRRLRGGSAAPRRS